MSIESTSAITKLDGGMAPIKRGVDFDQGLKQYVLYSHWLRDIQYNSDLVCTYSL